MRARSRRKGSILCSIALLLVVAGACATSGDPTDRGRRGAMGLSVEVRNQTQNAVTVYAWSPSFRDRLGMVESIQRRTFDFQWTLAGPVQFMMDFLAQGCVISEPISVAEGDELILTVQPFDRRRARRGACP